MSTTLYPVHTLAVWTEDLPQPIYQAVSDKAAAMAAEGKTDNTKRKESISSDPVYNYKRSWIDTDAANEWIAFIESVGGPLVSIKIV